MIYRYNPASEFEIDERCAIIEMVSSQQDASCSIARARVKPGVTTALHSVTATVERYIILEGEGVVTVSEQAPQPVKPLDVVWIDKGVSQKIFNSSKYQDLVFLCICTPGFRPEAFVMLE